MASSAVPAKILVTEASSAFKLLNGVVCLYKPLGYSKNRTLTEFKLKMCQELNQMTPPPREERVEIRRVNLAVQGNERIPLEEERILTSFPDREHQVEVVKGLSYADHPLIIGTRYKPKDLRMMATGPTSAQISGVHLFGINHLGIQLAKRIYESRWLRTFRVSGRFGIATDNLFHKGHIIEKSTFHNVKKHMLQRFLISSQATHQTMAFQAAGVPIDSDRAFELASQGLVRPATFSHPVIYSLKLVDFLLPDFTIELKSINEDFEYFKRFIHDLGLKLHSNAVCTKIHCTNHGPFGVEDALLLKHWKLEHVLESMKAVKERLKDFNMNARKPWVMGGDKVKTLEEFQNEEQEKENVELEEDDYGDGSDQARDSRDGNKM